MPSFPTVPVPRDVSPVGVVAHTIRFVSDDGIEVTRARYTRERRIYDLLYQDRHQNYTLFADFFRRETRGRALTFDFTMPQSHSITNESTGTPIVITTAFAHGLIDDDQVFIAGTSAANGTWTITRTGSTTLSLNGSTGGVGGSTGTLQHYLPTMRFASDRLDIPQRVDPGVAADDFGLWSWTIRIEESL